MNIQYLLKATGHFVKAKSPTILSGLAAGGVILTAIMASKASIQAHEALKEIELPDERKERIKLIAEKTWQFYLPAIGVGALTVGAIVCSNSIHLRRTAALAGAYSLAQQGLREFQEVTRKQIGDAGVTKIKEEIAQRQVDKSPPGDTNIILAGGDTLCRDEITGRYFRSSIQKLRKIENDLNYKLRGSSWLGLNELYMAIGLDPVGIGEELGWIPDNQIEFRFDTALAPNEAPCVVVSFVVDPRTDPYRSI